MMYSKALESGLSPSEFWDMSIQEVRDTVNARLRHQDNNIYTLSAMIRLAVLSVFSSDVQFPAPQIQNKEQENWKNSYSYMKELQKIHKRGDA